jgi:hypothetical protein
MVQARTRIMNQLQAVVLKEGLRCKKRLWREKGRKQLEAFQLAPWASHLQAADISLVTQRIHNPLLLCSGMQALPIVA